MLKSKSRIATQLILIILLLSGLIISLNANTSNSKEIESFTIDKYIKNLGSRDIKTRNQSISFLHQIGGLAIPNLINNINGSDNVEKHNSEIILNHIIQKSNLNRKILKIKNTSRKNELIYLITLDLNGNKKDLRLISVFILGAYAIRDKKFMPILFNAFNNNDEDVRDIAEQYIAYIGGSAMPKLLIALKDENENIHNSAVQSFVYMGGNANSTLLKVFKDKDERIRNGAVNALAQIINIQSEFNLNNQKSSENHTITKDDLKIIHAFTQALEDKNSDIRSHAAYGLRAFGSSAESAMPNLLKALSLSNADSFETNTNNFQVIWTLAAIGTPGAPKLIAALEDPNEHIRAGAVKALAQVKTNTKNEYVPHIIKLLKDKKSIVRASAITGLGDIGYQSRDAIHELIFSLKDKDSYVQSQAVRAIGEISYSLLDYTEKLSENDLYELVLNLDKSLMILGQKSENKIDSSTNSDSIKKIRRSLKALISERNSRFSSRIFGWIKRNSLVLGVGSYFFFLLASCFLLLRIRPLWILNINNILSKLPSDLPFPPPLDAGFKVVLYGFRLVIVVGFFHYHPRVLDSWVKNRIATVRENFAKKDTVFARDIHVPTVPISINYTKIFNLTNKDIYPLFSQKRSCLLICGEGGSGKTSLVCQLAKWSMSDNEDELFCKNRMLPILLEQDLDLKITDGKNLLLEEIRGQLQALTEETEPISEDLCKQLLRKKRILLIIDHLSEMNESTQKEIRPGSPDFPANALIITSRVEFKLDEVPKNTIKPYRINSSWLSSFIEDYLVCRGKRNIFNNSEFFDACSILSKIVGQRDITVLLAKLYAEYMIAKKEGSTHEVIANIPDLTLSYLNELNRGAKENKLDNYKIHGDAKKIAWECLKNSFRPASAHREDILLAIGGDDSNVRLNYLHSKLHILQIIKPSENYFRFTLDPLAEQLASMYIVETFKNDEQQWSCFLEKVDTQSLDEIQSFLLAIQEYLEIKMQIMSIRESILEMLKIRIKSVDSSIEAV